MPTPEEEAMPAEPGAATIMVVEPDILARMVIAEYLRECGYRVVEGVAGADVLAVLRARQAIDILLIDVHLPGETEGFALARQVRESYPEVDVILTSGAPNAADKASDLCDDGPVAKPYHPQEILRRIRALRERRRTSQKPLG